MTNKLTRPSYPTKQSHLNHLLYPNHLPSPFQPSNPPCTLNLRTITHNTNNPPIIAPLTHLEPPLLVPRRAGRVRRRDALERGGAAVADASGQRRVAAGVDARVAAREGDVGVAEEGEGVVAVVEAAGQVAELDAVVAGVRVGEPRDVLAAGFFWGVVSWVVG